MSFLLWILEIKNNMLEFSIIESSLRELYVVGRFRNIIVVCSNQKNDIFIIKRKGT
jgi:hypothetical protein